MSVRLATILLITLVALPTATAGGDVITSIRLVLSAPNEVVLISLEPEEDSRRDDEGDCIAPCLQGWPVLGEAIVAEEQDVLTILAELTRWVDAPDPEAVHLCFSPSHAVLVRGPNRTLQFVICYECERTQVFDSTSHEPIAELFLSASSDTFDAMLSRASIQLATPPDMNDGG